MRTLKLIILSLMVCCVQSAWAEEEVFIDSIKYSLNEKDKTATLKFYGSLVGTGEHRSYYTGDIVVPSSLEYSGDTYTVTAIEGYAFKHSSITSISIPESVTSLGGRCFEYCKKLTSITIPESVTSLEEGCFSSCYSLTSISIPESVTSLGDYCFESCGKLTSITIPESVTSLGYKCFYHCSSLTSINIPESVTSLGARCFSGCSSLTSITIPEGVTSLGGECFCGCSSLTSINIPESVTSLGVGCFADCRSLTSINIPEGVTSLGYMCFYDCSSLTGITIPESVTSLGYECFSGCSSLTSITIPESVTSLGGSCFSGCSSLTSITIPESVTSLGGSCFSGCTSLTSIIIPGSVTSLGDYCFSDCTKLTSIIIPGSVTSLGDYCFSDCTKLTVVTCKAGIPPTVGKEALSSSIAKLYVPHSAMYKYSCDALWGVIPNIYSLVETIALPDLFINQESTEKILLSITPGYDPECIIYTSDNESVATVDGNGVVTGVGPGTATITATTTDGSNLSASCVITVGNFGCFEWTEVTNSNIGSLTGGSVIKIFPYGYGGNENMALTSSTYAYHWLESAVTVGNEWTLVDAGDGTFYLRNGVRLYWAFQESESPWANMRTVSDQSDAVRVSLVWNTTYSGVAFKNAHDGTYLWNRYGWNDVYNWYDGDEPLTYDSNYTYNVYVKLPISGFTLSQTTAVMSRAETLQLTATVLPANPGNALFWSSSDESVATVTSTGLVTAVSKGTATITATTTDGSNISASCVITVAQYSSKEWTKVTNSNIGSLTVGSVIKICPYGYGGNKNMALSSSTTGGYSDYVLTSTERAGQEGGNEWILVDAGDGTFYLRNWVGLYWAFQLSDSQDYYMITVSDQSDAVKMSLVWNTTYSGVAFKNAHDGTYLCNLDGDNYAYNWYNGDEPLTSDTNYTYNVYVSSDKAAGIDDISADEETDAVYYQLNGVKLAGEPQKEGIYIRVKDGQSRKVLVKRK